MKIGFTGTRRGLTEIQKSRLEQTLRNYGAVSPSQVYLAHGDAIGADQECHAIAKEFGFLVFGLPAAGEPRRADCDHWGLSVDPLARNREIVRFSDVMVACPAEKDEQLRSGTWATIRHARQTRKPLTVIFPDGTVSRSPA